MYEDPTCNERAKKAKLSMLIYLWHIMRLVKINISFVNMNGNWFRLFCYNNLPPKSCLVMLILLIFFGCVLCLQPSLLENQMIYG